MQNSNHKNGEVSIHLSQKIDFKTEILTGNKEGLFVMINMSIHPEIMMIINTYISSDWAPKYKKQKLTELKGESDNSR